MKNSSTTMKNKCPSCGMELHYDDFNSLYCINIDCNYHKSLDIPIKDRKNEIVIIEVSGGVAECTNIPKYVDVRIVDWDILSELQCPECGVIYLSVDISTSEDRFICNGCGKNFYVNLEEY